MNDSLESSAQGATWLVLFHRLPPKPDYLRVKVRRRLAKLGAVPLKNSVYVLPETDEALEDLQWLAREIEGDGGEAMIGQTRFISGVNDDEIHGLLREHQQGSAEAAPHEVSDKVEPGRTWVTREGAKVDRMASAWLIRTFIDRDARFRFAPAKGYRPRPDELRFDMFEAEYGHESDRCTFETLVRRFGIRDKALRAVGEVVHDIDLKDDKYGRDEKRGIASLVEGIVMSTADDDDRLARGGAVFADLYAFYQKQVR